MGTVFGHLGASHHADHVEDDTVLALLGVFWPLLEKLFRSSHIGSGTLSAAACRSLSQAIHSSGSFIINDFGTWGKFKVIVLNIYPLQARSF